MVLVNNSNQFNYESVPVETDWNEAQEDELLMHTIHAYPAKFPSFVASKAFEYAKSEGVHVHKVADIFCGCGTVALESKERSIDFWGCDINPVATMIARVKSRKYDREEINDLYNRIITESQKIDNTGEYEKANERLKYWFSENSYCNLMCIYKAIEKETQGNTDAHDAFMCIFSSILKGSSRWLTKSIKPQVDINKKDADVSALFRRQYKKFLRALEEVKDSNSEVYICEDNFLTCSECPSVDLILSSPPYVTSYEYADLHQLSSLWLGYTDDYRTLRKGSIGSIYNCDDLREEDLPLNSIAREIVSNLVDAKCPKSKRISIARYFCDMQVAIGKCSRMVNPGGMVFFVIGDTEYKGVKVSNVRHLVECLQDSGFSEIKVGKRTISKGICVPYRSRDGRFTKDKSSKQIYHEEFIVSGRMNR